MFSLSGVEANSELSSSSKMTSGWDERLDFILEACSRLGAQHVLQKAVDSKSRSFWAATITSDMGEACSRATATATRTNASRPVKDRYISFALLRLAAGAIS
jgi:hypothetical protein